MDSSYERDHRESLTTLAIGALGVVFGDIGTSPRYALKESFIGHHPLAVDQPHIFGVISLMFWTMMMIVTLKFDSATGRLLLIPQDGTVSLMRTALHLAE